MKLLTKDIEKKLRANYELNVGKEQTIDHKPVVKFFHPVGSATWLITELDPDNIMFGLCDLGYGSPEMGYVALSELKETLAFNMPIERDRWFKANKKLTEYADEARKLGGILA
tara:strand:+ start:232 stop:570 length:339 start_codon:yes stop_codon:yes gene_type:complete